MNINVWCIGHTLSHGQVRSISWHIQSALECVTNITITGLDPYLIIVIFASTFESLVPASRSTLLLEHLRISGCKMEQGNRDCELARKKEAR